LEDPPKHSPIQETTRYSKADSLRAHRQASGRAVAADHSTSPCQAQHACHTSNSLRSSGGDACARPWYRPRVWRRTAGFAPGVHSACTSRTADAQRLDASRLSPLCPVYPTHTVCSSPSSGEETGSPGFPMFCHFGESAPPCEANVNGSLGRRAACYLHSHTRAIAAENFSRVPFLTPNARRGCLGVQRGH
jgi:hypothetical protein